MGDVPGRSARLWHYGVAMVFAVALMAPTVYVVAVLQQQAKDRRSQSAQIARLEAVVARQATTLTDHGLPASGAPGADGKAGTPGADGKDGHDGKGGLSIRGQTGQPGAAGRDGKDATPAKDGKDGAAGQDGASVQGPPGPPGRDGLDGKDGRDGVDGVDGKDGAPGPAPMAVQVPDGLGGQCFATDPDGDGVYVCPEVA